VLTTKLGSRLAYMETVKPSMIGKHSAFIYNGVAWLTTTGITLIRP